MVDGSIMAVGAGGRDGLVAAADVAAHLVLVGVEYGGEEAVLAESLPAAVITNSERGGAATIMEDE